MKPKMKKIVCGALASVMLVGTSITAYAAHPFTDVSKGSWYDSYVDYAYENHLMAGTATDKFSPNSTMTRGMLVTVLHRLAGNPEAVRPAPFEDLESGSWYKDAVDWCYGEGITAGTTISTFSPNYNVTREQMVVFMKRYAEYHGMDVSKRDSLGKYSDADRVSTYAKDAMSWAVAEGLVEGTSSDTLSPKDGATRAECAVILQRYNEMLNGSNPDPTEPAPTEPKPTEPAPTEPKPTEPAPTEPKPTEPKPTEPAPTEPKPTEPAPTEPKPTEPAPTDPKPTEPAPTEPKPEPPKPDPEPPVHTHDWKHTHHDAVGHYEEKFVCIDCGWYCTESMAEAMGMDIATYWTLNHQDPMDAKGESHSYDADNEWHVDAPAYDEWSCSCGEVVYSNPNA